MFGLALVAPPGVDPAALITVGVGTLMILLGRGRDMLERRPTARCACCGRRLEGVRCRQCVRRSIA
jgi:hypothetical protein